MSAPIFTNLLLQLGQNIYENYSPGYGHPMDVLKDWGVEDWGVVNLSQKTVKSLLKLYNVF